MQALRHDLLVDLHRDAATGKIKCGDQPGNRRAVCQVARFTVDKNLHALAALPRRIRQQQPADDKRDAPSGVIAPAFSCR